MSIVFDNDQTYHYRTQNEVDEQFQKTMEFFEKQVENQMNFWKNMFIVVAVLTTVCFIVLCVYCIRMNRQQQPQHQLQCPGK